MANSVTWYERVVSAHTAVTAAVSHGKRLKSERYFVWQEEGRSDLEANGRHAEKGQRGRTSLYTKQEFDPWKERFEAALDLYGLSWTLNSTQYEEDTGFWHYEWIWGVRYG